MVRSDRDSLRTELHVSKECSAELKVEMSQLKSTIIRERQHHQDMVDLERRKEINRSNVQADLLEEKKANADLRSAVSYLVETRNTAVNNVRRLQLYYGIVCYEMRKRDQLQVSTMKQVKEATDEIVVRTKGELESLNCLVNGERQRFNGQIQKLEQDLEVAHLTVFQQKSSSIEAEHRCQNLKSENSSLRKELTDLREQKLVSDSELAFKQNEQLEKTRKSVEQLSKEREKLRHQNHDLEKRMSSMVTFNLESKRRMEETMKEITSNNRHLHEQLNKTQEMCNAFEMNEKKLSSTVSQLREEIECLKGRSESASAGNKDEDTKRSLQEELSRNIQSRKKIRNEIHDIQGSIRVFCRIRPPKQGRKFSSVIDVPEATTGNNWKLTCEGKTFLFDRLFEAESRNVEVYSEISSVVETILEGSNVCILTYGQTGSGKTFTMDGSSQDPGIRKRALRHLFDAINQQDAVQFEVYLSAMEIYRDHIYDLLGRGHENKLQIRGGKTNNGSPEILGLRKQLVKSVKDAEHFMELAQQRRSTSSTAMNSSSSRSHSIVEIELRSRRSQAVLHLVDLAGSERVSRSKVTGERLKEAASINKSLAALGNVFAALKQRQTVVPYRDSKLTHLLRGSIGGNAKTLMFVNVSDDTGDKIETKATLQFGKRVRGITFNNNASDEKAERLRELLTTMTHVDREIERVRVEISSHTEKDVR